MKRLDLRRTGAITLLAVMLMGLGGCSAQETTKNSDVSTAETEKISVDFTNISPKEDFYGYVNGELLGTADIEMGYENVGAFGEVNDNVQKLLISETKRIVNSDEEYEYGSKEWIIKNAYDEYYASLDEDYVKAYREKAFPEVKGTLEEIQNAKTPAELLKLSIENDVGIYPALEVGINRFNSSEYCVEVPLYKKILGVYFDDINDYYNSIGDNNQSYIDVFKALGDTKDEAREKVIQIEYMALDFCWSTEPEKANPLNFNLEDTVFVSNEELEKIFTNIDYKDVEKTHDLVNPYGGWYCYSINQLKGINELYDANNLEVLRNMIIAEYCMANADVLSNEYKSLAAPYIEPADKEMATIMAITRGMNYIYAYEKVYVELIYDEEADRKLRDMCDDIIGSYEECINNASWITEETKEKLVEKLDNMIILTAKDIDTSALDIDLSDCFTGDYHDTFNNFKELKKRQLLEKIGQTPDRFALDFPMQMVNARYDPQVNNVIVCLAIQQSPFFDKNGSYGYNLGTLGAIIGHEIGHGFDSEGIQFDMNGAYNPNWICQEDLEKFEAKNQEAIEYFETAFTVYNIYTVNGKQTLGENYADLAGVEACINLIDNEDDLRDFFESNALTWAMLNTVDGLKDQIKSDVHSPEILRCNAVIACFDEFYELYDVKEGDGMYIAPENRISRWK